MKPEPTPPLKLGGPQLREAALQSLRKLDPRHQIRNPVMLVVLVGSALTTGLWIQALVGRGEASAGFIGAVALFLWATVLFANLAEALAEGRGKAQAREASSCARLDNQREPARRAAAEPDAPVTSVPASSLRKGTPRALWRRESSFPPTASRLRESPRWTMSAVTGESAPVIRESGGDRSAVTGRHARALRLDRRRVTADPGEGFLDRMISLVEGASRQRTPNEIALAILLAALHPGLPRGDGHAAALLGLRGGAAGQGEVITSPPSSRCSCAWRPRPSARSSRPSGSPAWTA
jgi:K+-transporting ATPase ATPase B chain